MNFALPRVRDFRGIPDRGFDGRGNFTLGIKEHTIFPELEADRVENPKGMAVGSANNMAGQASLTKRIGWSFLILCCYRIGVHVPIPGVDASALASFFQSMVSARTPMPAPVRDPAAAP